MKLHILSDLHLEFKSWEAPATEADVIILAGDIGSHTHGLDWAVRQAAFAGKLIIYIIGNHEFYGTELIGLRKQIFAKAEALRAEGHQIFVLDDKRMEFDGCRVLAATLWTDYKLFGDGMEMAFAMNEAKRSMNDHSCIFYAERGHHLDSYSRRSSLFLPIHAARIHSRSRAWLSAELNKPFAGKTVVVTHHLPSMQSVAERFKNSALSAAFASNMDALVEKADLWIHGHTHDAFDYRLGRCRVVCNPKGYPGEQGTAFRPDLIVEV